MYTAQAQAGPAESAARPAEYAARPCYYSVLVRDSTVKYINFTHGIKYLENLQFPPYRIESVAVWERRTGVQTTGKQQHARDQSE